jgi:uncharacterized protein with von Willebrand factor type A (vWA) domain
MFNLEIMEHVLGCEDYPALKAICEGRDLPAFEAVKEFSGLIFQKLEELLNAADGGKNLHSVLDKLEKQAAELSKEADDLIEKYISGGLDEKEEKELLKSASQAIGKQKQAEAISDIMRQNMRKSKGSFNDVITSAVTSAREKAEEANIIISSWGTNDSSPESVKHNNGLLGRVRSSEKILGLVKYLGRYMEIMENARKNSFAFGRGDKYDITMGNDFTRAVSSEYAYLAMQETVPLFIQKVQRKSLKQYRKRERVSKGFGDLVVCLDESSSMKGDSIAWAKAVALTLIEAVNRNGRKCAVIRFASKSQSQEHVFEKGKYTADDVFSFAESFLSGGTDFERPLDKAVEMIENSGYENADVVFLTDGICSVSDEFVARLNEKMIKLNFSVTGIVMDADEPGMAFSLEPFCRKVYRLSELTRDKLAEDIIRSIAA